MNTNSDDRTVSSAASNDTGWQQHLHHNARHQRRTCQEPDIPAQPAQFAGT
jgi:hypothetical protein